MRKARQQGLKNWWSPWAGAPTPCSFQPCGACHMTTKVDPNHTLWNGRLSAEPPGEFSISILKCIHLTTFFCMGNWFYIMAHYLPAPQAKACLGVFFLLGWPLPSSNRLAWGNILNGQSHQDFQSKGKHGCFESDILVCVGTLQQHSTITSAFPYDLYWLNHDETPACMIFLLLCT